MKIYDETSNNPVVIKLKDEINSQFQISSERPSFVRYPVQGIPWSVLSHTKGEISVQQLDYFGNNFQLVEFICYQETEIILTVIKPAVFAAIMLEGFFRYYHKKGDLAFYGVGNTMSMSYSPCLELTVKISTGKHAILVASLEKKSVYLFNPDYPKINILAQSLSKNDQNLVVLPMCRLDKTILEHWENFWIFRFNALKLVSELVMETFNLINTYHEHLTYGNTLKSELSTILANKISKYIYENYRSDSNISATAIAETFGISGWKIREYANLLFDCSLQQHVRLLRMQDVEWLLVNTDIPILKIAESVGYKNQTYFYPAFKAYFNISPQKFRSLYRKNNQ